MFPKTKLMINWDIFLFFFHMIQVMVIKKGRTESTAISMNPKFNLQRIVTVNHPIPPVKARFNSDISTPSLKFISLC